MSFCCNNFQEFWNIALVLTGYNEEKVSLRLADFIRQLLWFSVSLTQQKQKVKTKD